jgi:hypothetical protein
LDIKALHRYSGGLDYSEAGRQPVLTLEGQQMISCSAWWDPAFAAEGKKGDASVLAIVFCDADGNYFLHDMLYLSHTTQTGMDPASQQCYQIAQALEKYHVPSVHVEINGIGRFLPQILRRELVRQKVRAAVVEVSSHIPKDQRIIQAFDTVLAARMLYVHDRVFQTSFLREMREWRPGLSGKGVDDGLDAVAGAILSEPVRIRTGFYAAGKNTRGAWRQMEQPHLADTGFDV